LRPPALTVRSTNTLVTTGRARAAWPPERHVTVSDLSAPPPPPLPSAEEQLVARVRAGDEGAFEALYLAHHDALWRFAYGYVHSREVAEELVQDVFLALWSGRAEWQVRTRVRAWLYAAVRHQALNHLRHERLALPALRARAGEDAAPPAMGAPPPGPDDALEARELRDAVQHAVEQLPERRRAAMTLRWKHDLAAPEIARVLGTTPEAVRVLLTRARRELAELLGRARR
jgi:RNA polymerase sigma-70 factor (ECF subfamily)